MRALAMAVLLAAFMAAQPARAEQRTLSLVSGGLSEIDVESAGVSEDGSIAFFETAEPLAASDTDDKRDVYGRTAAGALVHLSDGPAPDRAADARFAGASADGRHVYFETVENLLDSDTDASTRDLYERTPGGTLVHVSDNPIYPDNSGFDARFRGRSDDGSRVYFDTAEELAVTDTDWSYDIYELGPGGLRHVSDSLEFDDTDIPVSFKYASGDGRRVYFSSEERLALTDGDSAPDVYLRTATALIHLTDDPIGAEDGWPAVFAGETPDGSRFWFHTRERLATTDTDASLDAYERSRTGTLTHVTRDPTGPEDELDARVWGWSEDGRRLAVQTPEAMADSDGDSTQDVYLRTETGALVHVSDAGSIDEDVQAWFAGMPADGSRVVFGTAEPLVASDTDSKEDVYQRAPGGPLAHLSDDPTGPDAELPATVAHVSRDGARILLGTEESLAATDTDAAVDVYEHGPGGLHHLSGGAGDHPAYLGGATPDGRRVQFHTAESLVAADGDKAVDAYLATALPDPPAPPPPAGGAPARRDTTPPRLTRLRFAAGRIRFRLSEPATVRLRLQRGGRTRRTFAIAGRPGANRVRLRRPAAGRYRLIATPRDRAGNRGTPRRTTFRLR